MKIGKKTLRDHDIAMVEEFGIIDGILQAFPRPESSRQKWPTMRARLTFVRAFIAIKRL